MTRFSFSSLRVRLLLLVLLAVVPALGLIIYAGTEMRRTASMEAQANALRLAQSVSSAQDDLFEGARQLLTTLAQIPVARGSDPALCNALFSTLLKKYPRYANLGVTSPAGDAICSGLPLPGPTNFADRAWFQRAPESRDFVTSEYLFGRISRKAIVSFAYPILDEARQVQAVLFAGLDLDWLNGVIAKTELPASATLTVIDRKGTILARFPNPEKWVGKSIPDMPVVRIILSQGEGTAEVSGMDGVPRLYGFTPLGKARDAYVSVGVPKDVAFAPANRILTRNLVALGIVGLLALMAAWFGADLFVLRRVNDLVSTTKRLSAGDLSARTGLPYGEGELSELARTFDEMAGSMERLIAERKRAEEETQRHLQRVTALRDINTAITSTLYLHNILGVLLEKIDLFLPYAAATTIRLFDEESRLLEPLASRNIDEQEWRAGPWRGGRGIQGLIFESKTPQTIRNVETDPRIRDLEFYRKHKLVSYLGVPLIVKDKVLGVLSLYTKEEHEFSDEEVELLSTLAGQAAIAIQNAQLLGQTKEQAFELEEANKDLKRREEIQRLLKELSQDITRLDVDSLLKKLTTEIREMLKVDISDARIVEKGIWRVIGASGLETHVLNPPGSGTKRGLSNWMQEHRRPLMIPDIMRTDLPTGTTLKNLGLHGYLGVPLFSRAGEVIGVLRALTYQPREFTQEEVDLLQQLANGTAIALENAQLLEQTKRQAGELEKANKVKDEFLGFVSHELRTPVNALIGYAAMIQDKLLGEINPEQEKALEKVIARSRELLSMISGLLQATKIEAGAVKVESHEVALANFLEELRLAFDVLSNKEVRLIWNYPSDLPLVRTDGEKLRHILENLISNALKFTKKGSVKVSARILRVSDSPIPRTGEGENRRMGAVEFEVADTGIGIPKESLPAIFEMFRQVSRPDGRSSSGVGLGLHIAKEFTEMLGGKIDVESEVGKGSTFTVTIPWKI